MNTVAVALVPVFAVILVGALLRVTALIKDEHWAPIDHLTFYVLFPVLIVKTLATAELSGVPVLGVAGGMASAVLTVSALLYLLRKPLSLLLGLSPAGFTSLFQGVTRWHAFVAMSIVAALYGADGIALLSIGIAAMTPLVNLLNITILSLYGTQAAGEPRRLLLMIVRNPLIIACTTGVLLNVAPWSLPAPVIGAMDLIGRAALGIALLTVGAALRPAELLRSMPAVAATSLLRLVGMPALMLLFGRLYGLDGIPLSIMVIAGGVPTASAGYVFARQMGGDAELMASIITFQVLAAAITLPLVIWGTAQLMP